VQYSWDNFDAHVRRPQKFDSQLSVFPVCHEN
jgi:hypothetical protein